MTTVKNLVMGVTLGEAAGIGPELIVKSLYHDEIRNLATWVIAGTRDVFRQGQEIAGLQLPIREIDDLDQVKAENGRIYFIDLNNLSIQDYQLGVLSPASGRAAGDTLKYFLDSSRRHKIDGVIYGPLNKEALQKGGFQFKDELHLFADLLDCTQGFGEINIMDDLWVTRVTSHIPLKEVSSRITKETVLERIHFAHNTLTRYGVKHPKIFVASFNPHSGEGGLLGNEEIDEIIPAVEAAKQEGLDIHGPYAADTIFLRRENVPFDCLLAMYHDQAQIGIKLLGFNQGVTMSAGLPVILATPAHGTAFDIAGKGIAREGATVAAIKAAVRMNTSINE